MLSVHLDDVTIEIGVFGCPIVPWYVRRHAVALHPSPGRSLV